MFQLLRFSPQLCSPPQLLPALSACYLQLRIQNPHFSRGLTFPQSRRFAPTMLAIPFAGRFVNRSTAANALISRPLSAFAVPLRRRKPRSRLRTQKARQWPGFSSARSLSGAPSGSAPSELDGLLPATPAWLSHRHLASLAIRRPRLPRLPGRLIRSCLQPLQPGTCESRTA